MEWYMKLELLLVLSCTGVVVKSLKIYGESIVKENDPIELHTNRLDSNITHFTLERLNGSTGEWQWVMMVDEEDCTVPNKTLYTCSALETDLQGLHIYNQLYTFTVNKASLADGTWYRITDDGNRIITKISVVVVGTPEIVAEGNELILNTITKIFCRTMYGVSEEHDGQMPEMHLTLGQRLHGNGILKPNNAEILLDVTTLLCKDDSQANCTVRIKGPPEINIQSITKHLEINNYLISKNTFMIVALSIILILDLGVFIMTLILTIRICRK